MIKELYSTVTGNSLTFGLLFPETYEMANTEKIAVYLDNRVVQHTVVDKMIRVELQSDKTINLFGSKQLAFVLDDVSFGVLKQTIGEIKFSNIASTFNNESVNSGYNFVVKLSINETTITVEDVLYDYVKGKKGEDGKSAYQSYLDTTSDNPPLTEEQWSEMKDVYTKTESDNRYLQAETDPVWNSEKSDYQTRTDNGLETIEKDIVPAINEVNSIAKGAALRSVATDETLTGNGTPTSPLSVSIDYLALQESLYSYGVLIDNNFSSPLVTRIGNLELHKTLPIHSNMKGCLLLDDGTVNYYLKPTDWTKKMDETASDLTGAAGQVMVEIPEYYVKYKTIDSTKTEVRISDRQLGGYTLKPKLYISAYKASLQRSNSKLSSVINLTADFRGGNNNASYDGTAKTFLGKPATQINLTNFRTYASNRGNGTRWNCMTYDLRKSLYWLFVIEYANLNSQAAVVGLNSVTGFREGGLGNGMTNANGTEWNTFNGYYPFIPCGASNSLGNGSGEVSYVATDFGGTGVNRTFTIPRYRGVESPFGDIWEWTDGILIDVKTDASGGTSKLYTTADTTKFSSSSFADYIYKGLLPRTDGYIKNILFGADGDILPSSVIGGGSTTYYCDNFWRDINSNAIKGVFFGGSAADGSAAGLVSALTANAPSAAASAVGSRLCFV